MGDDTARQCATNLMDTFHVMMKRVVGPEARKRQPMVLTFPQFRIVRTIEHHEGASMSQVAEHVGATLSATSKLVEGLVERGYVQRETSKDDRRKKVLALTDTGAQVLASLHQEAISCLADRLVTLSPSECAMINLAMDVLRSALLSPQGSPTPTPTETSKL